MNPLQYRLGQVTKAAVAATMLGFACLGFFVAYDPNLVQATVVVVLSLSTVVSVFLKKNASFDDVTKAVEQLKGSVLTAVGFIATVPAATEVQVGVLVAAVLSFYPVWRFSNAHPPTEVEDEILEDVPDPPPIGTPPEAGLAPDPEEIDLPVAVDEGAEAAQARQEGVPPTEGTV